MESAYLSVYLYIFRGNFFLKIQKKSIAGLSISFQAHSSGPIIASKYSLSFLVKPLTAAPIVGNSWSG